MKNGQAAEQIVSDNEDDGGGDALIGLADGTAAISNPNILSLPVSITVSVGRARLTVQEIMKLTPDSIIPLDARLADLAEIFVGDRLIARGMLVDLGDDGGLGVRFTEICDPSSGA